MTARASIWRIAPISIATPDGRINIPGWSNGSFGIDWRPGGKTGFGFVITHLGAGYSMFAVLGNLEDAQSVADDLTNNFQWVGSTVEEARNCIRWQRRRLIEFRDQHRLYDPANYLPPPGDHGGAA